MNLMLAVIFSLGLGLVVPPAPAEGEIAPREILGLASPGRAGRALLTVDPIQAAIVAGRWTPPKAGDTVPALGGPARAWEPIKAGGDGSFQHPALRGGYAFAAIPSDAYRVMILEAAGHAMVYINGSPRVGDTYSYGYVHLPVALKQGENSLLFAAGRGSLRFRLVAPRGLAMIDPADPTLPDLIVGRPAKGELGAVVIANASMTTLDGARLDARVDGSSVATLIPPIPPLGVRKIAFTFDAPAASTEGTRDLTLALFLRNDAKPVDTGTLALRVVRPEGPRKQTFISAIDGSVQYFGLVPASGEPGGRKPGLILTLHGASVEGIGQARVYKPKPWAHVVAPTNRRPYGFDWEDWGRLDAIEVLELAQKQLDADPRRVVLTGHSMGGHGTWHVGVTFPDRFAAIAPSAGWVSMFSYAGSRRPENPDPVAALASRALLPSDTLAFARNLERLGVYVLHGDADDNVPVGQARTMRKALGEFHPDFDYYERPGAGHWWGDECCDWPPLIDFLARHEIPAPGDVRRVDFVTASPGVSARAHWATIEAQTKSFERSGIHLDCDPAARKVSGTTENVARLALDLAHVKPGGPVVVALDGQTIPGLPEIGGGRATTLWLTREGTTWARAERPSPAWKGPLRSGPFKDAFRHRMMFVHGTRGTPEENAWALAKARYDAETFWYRGNGSIDVVPDTAFDPKAEPDRAVILFGNADTNAVWPALLSDGPVSVRRGSIRIGDREIQGEGLACLFVRPRPGSDRACVAAVSGTGLAGMRLADRQPYFTSGIAYPDLTVIGPEALNRGAGGLLVAGFFGTDWGVSSGEFAWRETKQETSP